MKPGSLSATSVLKLNLVYLHPFPVLNNISHWSHLNVFSCSGVSSSAFSASSVEISDFLLRKSSILFCWKDCPSSFSPSVISSLHDLQGGGLAGVQGTGGRILWISCCFFVVELAANGLVRGATGHCYPYFSI